MSNISKKRNKKREKIIKEATELMNEVGFENLTVRMICNSSDISTGTFYHYFNSKSELIIELFSLIDDYIKDEVIQRLDNEDELINIIEYCKGFAEFVILTGVEKSKLINSMFPNYNNSMGKLKERNRILYIELKKIIKRGQKKNQITKDYMAERLTDMIIIMIRGYCFDWARREGPYDLVENTVELISLFTKSIKIES